MNEIFVQKQELRKKYLKIRNEVLDKEKKSEVIMNKIIATSDYKKANVIALYKSFSSEVDTSKIIEHSIKIGKTVVLPKVVGNILKFYKIKSLKDNFLKSKFGIEEPIENDLNYIELSSIDLIIVPGLCFDKEKNRLGFGKGYYDRLLKNTKSKTIAICFKEQVLKNSLLPVAEDDIKVNEIITD